MKKFFFGSHWSRVHTAALIACIFAGFVLPALDWQAAVEAGWSVVIWCATYVVGAILSVYGLVLEHKRSTKVQPIGSIE